MVLCSLFELLCWKTAIEQDIDKKRSVQDVVHMEAITYTAARENLASTMDRVCEDHVPILVKRKKKEAAVVMLSLEDYEAMEATMHLFRSPVNVQRLLESIRDIKQGKGISKTGKELFGE